MTATAKITTDAETLAVDLNEVRALLRMNETEAPDEDLKLVVQSATRKLEEDTGRSFITKTYTWYIDRFIPSRDPTDDFWYQGITAARSGSRNAARAIQLPVAPLVAITTLKYRDMDGTLQTVSSADYQVDIHSEPGRVAPSAAAVNWPSDVNLVEYLNPIEFIFTAGYGTKSENVPYRIRHAIIMLAGHFWEHPEATLEGAFNLRDVQGYQATVDHYKTRWF